MTESEQKLAVLRQKRSSIKGQITKYENYVSSFKSENATTLQTREFQIRLTKFEELSTKFDDIQSQIEVFVMPSELEGEIEERERIESKICNLIATSGIILNPVENNDAASSHLSVKSNDGAAFGHYQQIKLPTIKLPTFDGDHLKWLEFRDMFESLIHDNDHIPPMNKFHYLRSSLEGGAAVAIKSIDFTANNYNLAWELLCERFNNKRILINNHLKSLYNLEAFTKESHTSLRLMIDHVSKNLRALSSLGEPTEHWDTLIIFNMSSKLDAATGRKWEEHRSTLSDLVTLKEFYQFLRDRADVLETIQYSKVDAGRSERPTINKNSSGKQTKLLHVASTNGNKVECALCQQDHRLEYCPNFKVMNPESRLSTVRRLKLCVNCFRPGHHQSRCRRGPCTICNRKHNALVHIQHNSSNNNEANSNNHCDNRQDNSVDKVDTPRNDGQTSEQPKLPNPCVRVNAALCGEVLLCTAIVDIVGPYNTVRARAVLDNCSQSSFITEKLKGMLNLPASNEDYITICGINDNDFDIPQRHCEISVKSRLNSFNTSVSCLVIPKLTGTLPNAPVDYTKLNLPENIELADPDFFRPSNVDLLLGGDVFYDLVEENLVKLGKNKPTLVKSHLGWLVAGPIGERTHKTSKNIKCNFTREIKDRLSMFWELEEIPTKNKLLSSDEQFCEDQFNNDVTRLPDGRFSVKMPLKASPEQSLGDSHCIAKRRFFNLERKLQSKPYIKQMYMDLIHEYEQLGHLTRVPRPDFGYVLPHYAVIRAQPKTVVCNRIQEIRDLTDKHAWRHVPTDHNPADLASRGIKCQELNGNTLWWTGPAFLLQGDNAWPEMTSIEDDIPETKTNLNIKVNHSPTVVDFNKYSKLSTLINMFAYVLRFINACKNKNIKGSLTVQELNTSLQLLTKLSQAVSFTHEINSLRQNKKLKAKSSILSLNPFLDDNGILRVGGRLHDAQCSYDQRHPKLLDGKHPLARLIFRSEHLRLLHCGPQLLLSGVREHFWPTKGRVLARSTVHNCLTCKRLKAKTMQPIMGNLPKSRVVPAPPFETCGVDFAGPFSILNKKGRGAKVSKCYLCLFVCFFTKAVHLEVVSDLSTNSFILSLRRFISRRGKPKTIYCDNGTNFVGANSELQRMLKASQEPVNGFASSNGIDFKFSPAYSPNFGGLWEAGVKAAKFHLKRVVGSSNLTFEELTTLFTQVEAILNSRPLTPLSSDPSDLSPLTPGHFLIGRPLASLPSPPTQKMNLNRYHHLEALRQHFWKRWTREFLSDLQQRVKWRATGQGVKLGDLGSTSCL
ncbi:uncharacterized protein LOC133530870 [Cydia pomonella]|uniref:uncharacterized protein LOC133530870 n=1 Tax=Cydia pomonella TaxID=82600 RepID=UPI002ADDE281|nr:uncharacterized protein LOC133530870 [Cydia pomonella]